MADITPRKRSRISTRADHSDYTQKTIASLVGVSQKFVSRIIKQQAETGSYSPKRKGRFGRKRKTTPRDDSFLIRKSKLDPSKSSFDLQRDSQHSGVNISAVTVRPRLLEVGREARKPLEKQLLTKKTKQKQLAWAKKIQKLVQRRLEKRLISRLVAFHCSRAVQPLCNNY